MLRNNVFINSLFAFPFTGAHRNEILISIFSSSTFNRPLGSNFTFTTYVRDKPTNPDSCTIVMTMNVYFFIG